MALALDLKTYGERDPQVAVNRNNLGRAWFAMKDYKKANNFYELALGSFIKTFGDEHPFTQKNQQFLAWTHESQNVSR